MPRSDPYSCFSGLESGSGIIKPPRKEKAQQLACDRCRGQKLRCIRSLNPKAACERCQKAGATCIIDSSVRMGRPRRMEKDQHEERNQNTRTKSQTTRSPPLPTTASQRMASVDFIPSGETWSMRGLDDVPIDPTLQTVTAQYLESFEFEFSADTTLEEESVSMPTDLYLNPNLDLSLSQSIPTLTEEEGVGVDATEQNNDSGLFLSMRQETMQELSDLNMQLSRQLGGVVSATSLYTDAHRNSGLTALATPPDEKRTVSDTVIFMMHSLQTYHRLLVEILSSARPPQSPRHNSHENLKSSTVSVSRLSPIEGDGGEDSNDPMSEAIGQPPRKILRLNRNAELTAPQVLSHNPHLDMPTSLLLLSCHANLIYSCRDAFAVIRAAINTTNREISLFTISFLNIDSLSIPTEPDLQIIVLIQAVIRMIDRIGRLLGYPDDCETHPSSESKARSSAIPRRLLDLMLKSESCGDFPADRLGTQALREEMRQLHDLVYKPL